MKNERKPSLTVLVNFSLDLDYPSPYGGLFYNSIVTLHY